MEHNNLTPSTSTSSVSNFKQGGSRKVQSSFQNNGKGKGKNSTQQSDQQPLPSNAASSSASVVVGNKNKNKLEDTLLKLLSKMPKKNAVDASYLLEHDKRSRKRKIW